MHLAIDFFFVHFDFDWGQIAEICSTHLVDQWVEGLKVHAAFSPLDYLTWSLRLLLLLRCCWLANLNWSGFFLIRLFVVILVSAAKNQNALH